MKSSLGTKRDLAYALKQMAQRVGEQSPSVRGSDWRLATVTAVGTGTVTADGLVCRRMEAYTMPLVGDLVVISQSSSGNWRAEGRIDSGNGTGWQSYTPAWTATSTNPSIGNGSLEGRYTRLPNRTAVATVRLAIGSSTNIGSGTYVFGLPFATANDIVEYSGTARLSASATYIGQVTVGPNSSSMNVTFPTAATPASASNMTNTLPVTLTSGNILRFTLTFQHG
ncbi:hypothetical protein [Streptomyces sp. NPDC091299]|uniref:hypothetical protein n=1 Tax=Streptomyces sp. NPDC091299 TaxID=3155302 RepID=UPI003426A80A